MLKKFILLILLFLSSTAFSLTLIDKEIKYDNFTLHYLYDESSSLTIQDIQTKNFTTTIPSQFTKGYRAGNSWFKIDINNKSKNENFILYFTEPIWSEFDLYSKIDNKWNVQKNGLNINLVNRSIEDNNPAFRIFIKSGENKTYYIKGNTLSGHIGEFQVFTQKEFFKPSRISITQWYIVYSLVLFSILILNTYNFLVTRERIYAYYIAYIATFIVFSNMKSASYLSLGFSGWKEGLHVIGALLLMFLNLFSGKFLKLQDYMPLINKIFKLYAVIFLIFAILISINIPYSSLAFNIVSISFFILLFIVANKIWKKGFIDAKYYLIALIIYMPMMGMMALTFNTFLDNTDITRYSFLLGAFIEIIFFTFLLTNRYFEINHTNKLLAKRTVELEEVKNLLTIESTMDPLTTLYNRRYFSATSHKQFSSAKRYNKKLSMIMLDIDDFKHFNDMYGHQLGDKILKESSLIIKEVIRDSDTAARYGSEEFIILLSETNIDDAIVLAERIRVKIENNKIKTDDNTVNITMSLGVTQIDIDNDKIVEDTIKRCDKALYKAKEEGKNIISRIYT